ncbi:MAG: hypothetical protein BGO98_29475 [Myxococcales bacterium 68-20]|nr:phage holin family protein [Myxococcales bacterium]OJY30890.1 MAG: hypothetical protein BGO98_29475 [Myxococcales bacterium 68-20]
MKQHIGPFVMFALGLFAPIQATALALGFLVVIDVITGVWASVKAGQRVTSDRFGRTVTKSLVYLTAIFVAHVAELYVFEDLVPITKVVAGFVGSTELLSIYENLTRISGMDFRKLVIEKLRPPQREKEDRGE